MKPAVEVRERPILFSGPMVRAILEGRKTQTRRVAKDVPGTAGSVKQLDICPYGVPGDRLWVREMWWEVPVPTSLQIREGADTWPEFAYDADETEITREQNRAMGWRLRPSIFMPRWASRITLGVQEVRVQRVQEISEDDAKAEGCESEQIFDPSNPRYIRSYRARERFWELWDSINLRRGYSWAINPWVWCVTFKRLEIANQ